MSFQIRILGSGAALPTSNRNPSAQYINCNERHILIDCGEGTQNQLRKYGIKFQKIKHIFISHLHGDHYFGLMGLLSTMNLLGRDKGINLYAPSELKEIIDIQLKASGHHYAFSLNFIPLNFNDKTILFEDKLIEIYAFPLKHRIKTYGFIIKEKQKEFSINGELFKIDRVSLKAVPFFRKGLDYLDQEKNKSFKAEKYTFKAISPTSYAYCSDNFATEIQANYLNQIDFLYHEATFIEKNSDRAKQTLHSTAKQAALLAKKSKCKKLILGHISSRYINAEIHLQEAQEIFKNTIIAEDGLKIEF
jgi:ribonuclease Z